MSTCCGTAGSAPTSRRAASRNGDVGDRSNDAVRIDAAMLNCKVIGEGGNLGFSQLGRVEFALRGGRLNTDFIDNSAGVNCSDVEVNLKILLNGAVRAREITRAARDRLLVQMTDEVAAPGVAQQLPAGPGDQHQRVPVEGAPERERLRDPRARALRRSESRARVSALRGGDRRPAQSRRGAHPSGARHPPLRTARSGCTRR